MNRSLYLIACLLVFSSVFGQVGLAQSTDKSVDPQGMEEKTALIRDLADVEFDATVGSLKFVLADITYYYKQMPGTEMVTSTAAIVDQMHKAKRIKIRHLPWFALAGEERPASSTKDLRRILGLTIVFDKIGGG